MVDLIKGGLVADIGVRAFVPASQVDLRPQPNLESWKGQTITCRVIKMNRKRGNVVVKPPRAARRRKRSQAPASDGFPGRGAESSPAT